MDNDEPFTGQSIVNSTLPSGDAATILPIDAIQEVNVETNVPAEFGRRPGAVVNIGIKSGTNSIHGSAYAFGRDGNWDAVDFNTPRTPAELEQWGGTVGGPIVKNKLFYFGGFERLSYTVGYSVLEDIPTTASVGDAKISIPDATTALQSYCATGAIASFCSAGTFVPNPLSQKLLPLYGPNNTNGVSVPVGVPDVVSVNNVVGKIDYHINDHHTLAGSYFFGNGNSIAGGSPVTQPYFRDVGQLRAEFVTTSWTWTPNSAWVNDLRVGWNHHHRTVLAGDRLTPLSTYGINTGVTNPILGGLPVISVSHLQDLGSDGNLPKGYGPTSDYDLVDQASYLRGKHAFKFGGEILTFRANYAAFGTGRGRFRFKDDSRGDPGLFPGSTALESFLAGVPDPITGGNLLVGSAARLLTKWEYSGFFEDAWRVKSNVTVNLGLRYEYFTPLAEAHNLIGNWEPQVGLEQVGTNIKSAYNGYHKDISPRIGVAWDIGGKGKTVVRLGGGLYFIDIINSAMMASIALPGRPPGITAIPTAFTLVLPDGTPTGPVNPTNGIGSATVTFPGAQLNWTSAGPVFPAASAGSGSAFQCGNGLGANPAPCNILSVNRNLAQPYVESWNLGIQHSLTNNLSLEVNYIGNHGGRLPGVVDLNQINPQSPAELACGNCESITDRPYYGQYPYLQGINQLTNLDISNYNALQATLTGRGYHGLTFLVGYTYSHAIDDNSANYNESLPQNSFAPKQEYGNSDNDLRHHVSISLTYNIPGKKSWGQVLEGWAVNSAVALQSGLPWSPIDGSNDIGKTGENQDHWDFFGNPKDFNGGANPIPFYDGVSAPFPAACLGHPGTDLTFGCYAQGNSVLVAPLGPSFGTAGRNIFRDNGFRDWDFSLFKNFKVKERLTAQFRAEFFNVLNNLILANPGPAGFTDPSSPPFGCGCSTPDQAATNPILGTGGARAIQLGLKLTF